MQSIGKLGYSTICGVETPESITMILGGECKARGYAYAKIEYVSVRMYLSKNRIRV